jgi:hypothetical protein
MELRRPRFTVIALMGLVAACGIAMAVLVNFSSEADWVGFASIPLEFVVVDAASGKPIDGAAIDLTESSPEYSAVTGTDGRAKLIIHALISGRSSLRRETRSVNYSWGLTVTCDRYEPVYEALQNVTRDTRFHSDKAPPPIVIRLKAKVLSP